MVFEVKAYVANKVRVYTVEAGSLEEVPRALYEKTGESRTTILKVKKASGGGFNFFKKGVSRGDVEQFCRQLQILISSGETLLNSLSMLAENSDNQVMKRILEEAAENVRAGFRLSGVLERHRKVFGGIFCSSMKVAEETGKIEDTLGWIADKIKKEIEIRKKMGQAMTYPILVVCMSVAVTLGLFIFVVPQFAVMLEGAGVELPFITRGVMWVAYRIHYVFIMIIGIIAGFFAVIRYMRGRMPEVYMGMERAFLKVPVVGKVWRGGELANFFWSMNILIKSGVVHTQALEMAAGSAGFMSFRQDINKARENAEKGGKISEGFSGSCWMTPLGKRMILIGEESGKLDVMTKHAAEFMEEWVDELIGKMPALVEVGSTVFVGGIVLVVLLALFLPYANIMQVVK